MKIHFISVTHPEIEIDMHHKIVSIFGFCSLEYYMLFVLCHSFVIGETYAYTCDPPDFAEITHAISGASHDVGP